MKSKRAANSRPYMKLEDLRRVGADSIRPLKNCRLRMFGFILTAFYAFIASISDAQAMGWACAAGAAASQMVSIAPS